MNFQRFKENMLSNLHKGAGDTQEALAQIFVDEILRQTTADIELNEVTVAYDHTLDPRFPQEWTPAMTEILKGYVSYDFRDFEGPVIGDDGKVRFTFTLPRLLSVACLYSEMSTSRGRVGEQIANARRARFEATFRCLVKKLSDEITKYALTDRKEYPIVYDHKELTEIYANLVASGEVQATPSAAASTSSATDADLILPKLTPALVEEIKSHLHPEKYRTARWTVEFDAGTRTLTFITTD